EALVQGESVYMEPDDLVDIAEYYHSRNNDQRALQVVEYAITLFPGATQPLVFRARLALLTEDDPDKADNYADQIDDQTDLDYYYIKAEILVARYKIKEAETYLAEKWTAIDEDEREDFALDVATLYADYDVFDKAQKWLMHVSDNQSAYYKELKGRIALGKGNYEESESIFNELIDEDPYSSPYWNNLASSQFLRNHVNESITSSEFSIAINPNDDEAILNKANGLFSLGNYEEALKYYDRFTQLCPDEETGEIFKGITLVNLNRPEEAVEHLKRAEQLADKKSPNLNEIYRELAFTLSHIERLSEALGYVDKINAPEEADKADVNVLKGHLLLENGRLEEAQECFTAAMTQTDSDAETFLKIAVSVYDCGFVHLAYKMLHSLLDHPTNADWDTGYSYLALCCKQLGKTQEFLQTVKKACERNPEEAKTTLADLFPPGIEPNEYYNYLINNE
ncbi:MAG TPA: tetratricopeptide repeat protein, partial [Prevotella sp.]